MCRLSRPLASALMLCLVTVVAGAQVADVSPVTTEMLENPAPEDWLSFSRTPDAQRYSPLDQINSGNVQQLEVVWSRDTGTSRTQESIPIVHDGVIYMIEPGSDILALDGTNGELIWEYEREYSNPNMGDTRSKTIAIYEDVVITTTPDSYIVGIDARTGEVRWETQADQRGHTSGPILADGKVISGGTCTGGLRENCYIAAHDARTGELLWKFYTAQAPDDPPGFDTWAGAPLETRRASTWGMSGSYDPEKHLIYWGIANPTPNTRLARHGGDPNAIPVTSPADLYSNSTVALDPDTGELVWYYQHLPGDDWDQDVTNERILITTPVAPDPEHVKWINPDIEPGEVRDVVTAIGEPGGLWVLDRETGEFLWATPFPYDTPNFAIRDIDVATGDVYPNFEDLGFQSPGEQHIICFFNTTSYWPSAYHPGTNALYVPWVDNCLDMTAGDPPARDIRGPVMHSETLDEYAGVAKINMETGEIEHIYKGQAPGNGAVLATAGNLVFWGDTNRTLHAFNAETGDALWQGRVSGPITNSTITYAVDGRQYIAVFVGVGAMTGQLMNLGQIEPNPGINAITVFALPE
jgi:alcohol dehydrogenase (cytochrome c)